MSCTLWIRHHNAEQLYSGLRQPGPLSEFLDEAKSPRILDGYTRQSLCARPVLTAGPGFFIALLVYTGLNWIFPPPGLGEGTYNHDEDKLVLPSAYRQDRPTQGQYSVAIDGEAVSDDGTEKEPYSDTKEKGADV